MQPNLQSAEGPGQGPRLVLVCASVVDPVCRFVSPLLALPCLDLPCACIWRLIKCQTVKTCHRAGGPFFSLGMITSKPSQDHRAALSTRLAPPTCREGQCDLGPDIPGPSVAVSAVSAVSAAQWTVAGSQGEERWSWKRLGIECNRAMSQWASLSATCVSPHACTSAPG